jgi:hypothetical protein
LHTAAFCPVSAARVPNIFTHNLYVLILQEDVGALYCNILSKKASLVGFFARVHAFMHACMCVTVIMGVVSVFAVC